MAYNIDPKNKPQPGDNSPSIGLRGGVLPENDPNLQSDTQADAVFNEMYQRSTEDIMNFTGSNEAPTMPGAGDINVNPGTIKQVGQDAGLNVEPQNQEKHNTEMIHLALAAAGTLPIVGVVADVIDTGLYLAEGDLGMAGLSFISAIPVLGTSVGAAKVAKGVSTSDKAFDAMRGMTGGDKATDIFGGVPNISEAGKMFSREEILGAGMKLDKILGVNDASKLKNMITTAATAQQKGKASVKAIEAITKNHKDAMDAYYGAKFLIDPNLRRLIQGIKQIPEAQLATIAKQYGMKPEVFADLVQKGARGLRVLESGGPEFANEVQQIVQREVQPVDDNQPTATSAAVPGASARSMLQGTRN